MFDVGLPEMIVIMVIALVVFGPKKLPEIGKSLGKAIRELKKAGEEVKESFNEDTTDSRELRNPLHQDHPSTDSIEKDTDFTEPAAETTPIPAEAVPAEAETRAPQNVEPAIPLDTSIHEKSTSSLRKEKAEGGNKEKPTLN
jgi:sec-independent protein translocase protein TatA